MAWEGSSGSVPNAKARALHRVVTSDGLTIDAGAQAQAQGLRIDN
jgi:hypothetical protein